MVSKGVEQDLLLAGLAAQGMQARMVSVQHLSDLQEGIEAHHRAGLFDDEFYRTRLSVFRYAPPVMDLAAQSLIVVAVPRPQTEAAFTWQGRPMPAILPPTYTGYERIAQRVSDLVASILEPAGHQVVRMILPLKQLAVRSGLGAYGRNNLCYVPGMGSFLELVGLCSSLPCTAEEWQEPRRLAACEHCRACAHRCPSGAIPNDRFLLRAERCLVFHNEKPASVPFAPWIDPSWHNCLEGCMDCQLACPENKPFWGWIEGREEFSEEETALFLQGVEREELSDETLAKLERLDIVADLGILPRNLRALLIARGLSGPEPGLNA